MSMLLMISKSIITYTLLRTTRSITKSGFDAAENHLINSKLSRCPRCGNIDGEEFCDRCGEEQHKMYKAYEVEGYNDNRTKTKRDSRYQPDNKRAG